MKSPAEMQGIPVIPSPWLTLVFFILLENTISYKHGMVFAPLVDVINSKKKGEKNENIGRR
jgi:hypothetical protein